MNKEEAFWAWFLGNSNTYLFIHEVESDVKERLLKDLLRKIHAYSIGLSTQIRDAADGRMELIITAEGNKEFFQDVESLVHAAPDIKDWNVIAFKQPCPESLPVNFGEVEIAPEQLMFLPLTSSEAPGMIHIRVVLQEWHEEKSLYYRKVVVDILNNLLGERSLALDIDHLEIASYYDNINNLDRMFKLPELPDYIKWCRSCLSGQGY